jgi:hypothetical protein
VYLPSSVTAGVNDLARQGHSTFIIVARVREILMKAFPSSETTIISVISAFEETKIQETTLVSLHISNGRTCEKRDLARVVNSMKFRVSYKVYDSSSAIRNANP